MDCLVTNQKGEVVLKGEAKLMPPTQKVKVQRIDAPRIQLFDPEARQKDLLARVQSLEAVRCAVVHPCDEGSLSGAMDSARHGLIIPVLIGPEGVFAAWRRKLVSTSTAWKSFPWSTATQQQSWQRPWQHVRMWKF